MLRRGGGGPKIWIFTPSPPKPPLPSNPAAGGNFSLIPPTGGLEGDFYAVALHSKPGGYGRGRALRNRGGGFHTPSPGGALPPPLA